MNHHSTFLQTQLELLHAGDDNARSALIEHAIDRFRILAHRMLSCQGDGLRRLNDTDDVLQPALLRLHRALARVKPADVRAFVGLAARQIRWVLQDLARQAAASKRLVYTDVTDPEEKDRDGEPADLMEWTELHERIEALPDEDREMFDLLLYEGLTQTEAAEVLHTSVRTVKRRWQRARLRLRGEL